MPRYAPAMQHRTDPLQFAKGIKDGGYSTAADYPEELMKLVNQFGLGAYDGLFGPGVGSMLILAFSFVFGDRLTRASGNAKVVNGNYPLVRQRRYVLGLSLEASLENNILS